MTVLPFALSVGLLVTVSCGLVYWGVSGVRRAESPRQRLERLTASPHPLEEGELDAPFTDRVLKPWLRHQIQRLGRLAPAYSMEKHRLNLIRAGHPFGLTVVDLFGVKLLGGLFAGAGALYLLVSRGVSLFGLVLFVGLLTVVGFLAPDFWLGLRVGRRQREIRRTLPDALDMLTICVDAGAGLASAMLKISQRWDNAISFEFGKVVAEMNIGMTRREALQNMALRAGVPEVQSFVAVLLQADQFGLSIARVLHTQSEQMRIRRWQRAEEESRKVPIKMLFPLVFLLLPAMMGITVGPAVPILVSTFSSLMGR